MRVSILSALTLLTLASSCAGGVSGDDTGGEPNGVAVSPNPAWTAPRANVAFAAAVTGAPTAVRWSVREASGGVIDPASGLYTAPAALGTFTVVATSVADARVSGQASVTVSSDSVETRLRALSTRRIYYQHASVGGESVGVYQPPGSWPNPTWGLDKICRDHPAGGTVVAKNQGYPTAAPRTVAVGTVSEWTHGALNGNPAEKLRQFDAAVRAFTVPVDTAILKLGWPDFDASGMVGTGMSQEQWFTTVYKPTMDALQAAYPNTRIIHATVPISKQSNYYGNDLREAWNARLRTAYPGRVWDLAYWLSVNRAGNRCTGGDGAPCMHADWEIPTDGHANQLGADWLGENLLGFLASLH